MPLLASALKKFRQDRRRTSVNDIVRSRFKRAISVFRKKPTSAQYRMVSSLVDKASKTGVIHKNKASRLKSRLAKLIK